LVSDFEKLAVGIIVVLVPMGAYAAVYLSSFNQLLALFALATAALMELMLAFYWLSRA
jgi:hypothetical protein